MADNPDIHLDEEALDRIVEDTIREVDLVGDGKINPEEWQSLVQRNPTIISYMTLPVLTQLAAKFPPSPETVMKAKKGGARLSSLNRKKDLGLDKVATGGGSGGSVGGSG